MKSSLLLFLIPALFAMKAAPASETAVAPLTNGCKTITGKPKPYPCEFDLLTLWFIGKNGEVLGKITQTEKSIKLPQSKALSSSVNTSGGTLFYNVSVDFRRIHKPSFITSTYTLSKASITDPISPGETTEIDKLIKVSPNLPPATIRPNRVMFKLALNYGTSANDPNPVLIAPIQLLQLENPTAFTQLPKDINHYRDRAEAWITFIASVDFKK
ncbi:hypothetical protein EXU85_17960 [Spirosoma sp. KCTC 42546]|uniref:hypothetical protein n=1 Tax=Spirosoma sp. KCTC 42546 TaxID=2520506 RepID=UPI001157852F|nr:hypothetical protein [Spirosoma sp. KCTC 42546]QDK80386.1 hypothetical protein EXU85_17960 [Spirosoma sp. KCTC 42546]